jgi:hypothetical protein
VPQETISRIFGIVLIVVGISVIFFGGKLVTTNGGVVLKLLSMPRFHAVVLKWVAGLLCVWFGVALLFGALGA